jgi:hypothetical protein
MALWSIRGREAEDIAADRSSNRRTVQEWCYRYRDRGIEGLKPIKPPGTKMLLPAEQGDRFAGGSSTGHVKTLACARSAPGRPDDSVPFYPIEQPFE